MEKVFMSKHTVSECRNCGEIIILQNSHDVGAVSDLFDDHLANNPKCSEWHDNLPTLESLRGINVRQGR